MHCIFKDNEATRRYEKSTGNGGALLIDSKLEDLNNQRISLFTIEYCTFEGNIAIGNGHAISISNNSIITLSNNKFNDNGDNSKSYLYFICKNALITKNNFTNDAMIGTRAVEITVLESNINQNIFNNSCSFQNGGAILLCSPNKSSNHHEIGNCTFIDCKSGENGGSLYVSEGVGSIILYEIIFDGGLVSSGEGICIFICEGVKYTRIEPTVSFINQECNNKFLIVTGCDKFEMNDNKIDNLLSGTGIKGINAISGTVQIDNVTFNKCISGIEIQREVINASIQNCIFFDCYSKSKTGKAVYISNKCCLFCNNIINYTRNDIISTGLFVDSYGDISILYNKFIRNNNIEISDGPFSGSFNDVSSMTLNVNYNLFEEIGIKRVNINIENEHQFSFDDNIVKSCNIDFTFTIQFSENTLYSHQFTLTNLTLLNCESKSQAGGLGLFLVFYNRSGKFSLINCIFENNLAMEYYGRGGNGGAFATYESTIANMELEIENCSFINNSAENYGGALSLRSTRKILINNCSFINNVAQKGGGGAIYVNPFFFRDEQMPVIEISDCIFDSNIDYSNHGHAIFFNQHKNATTRLYIRNNCIFKNNGNIYNNEGNFKGYTIFTESPFFDISDSIIEFSDGEHSTCALRVDSSISFIQNITFKKASSGVWYNTNDEYEAHAIYISNKTYEVRLIYCTFDHCGTFSGKNVIYDNGNRVLISLSNFYNDDHDLMRTGAITIASYGSRIISFCYIQNGFSNSGVISIKPTVNSNDVKEFSLDNITIDRCFGNKSLENDKIAFNCDLNESAVIRINYLTFKNIDNTNCHIFGIKLSDDSKELLLNNLNFTNITCSSLYGGGIGILIEANAKITFNNCYFINNKALQDQSKSRPTQDESIPYYNGDGGGIQIGYLCSSNNNEIIFNECTFKGNRAHRHGGAIAIQTLSPVSIIKCIFEDNCADSTSELLFDNHFHKKKEGRGGAIYINPVYNIESLHCSSTNNSFMPSVRIENCTFKANSAFDGYAIYIEGDDPGTNFSINFNEFNDNFNKQTLNLNSSIIASEICSISKMQIIKNNAFANREGDDFIYVNEFSCVDHNGFLDDNENDSSDEEMDLSSSELNDELDSSSSTDSNGESGQDSSSNEEFESSSYESSFDLSSNVEDEFSSDMSNDSESDSVSSESYEEEIFSSSELNEETETISVISKDETESFLSESSEEAYSSSNESTDDIEPPFIASSEET